MWISMLVWSALLIIFPRTRYLNKTTDQIWVYWLWYFFSASSSGPNVAFTNTLFCDDSLQNTCSCISLQMMNENKPWLFWCPPTRRAVCVCVWRLQTRAQLFFFKAWLSHFEVCRKLHISSLKKVSWPKVSIIFLPLWCKCDVTVPACWVWRKSLSN